MTVEPLEAIEQKLFNILQTVQHAPKYCKAIDRIRILPIQYEIFVIDQQFHWETLFNIDYADAMFYSFWMSSSEIGITLAHEHTEIVIDTQLVHKKDCM